jgi:small subunit ribosomal protein S3e
MLPKKILNSKVNERTAKEYLLKKFNRFAITDILIEKTPLGMRVVLKTPKPGLIVTRGNPLLKESSAYLGKYFNQEPPHIEVEQTEDSELNPEAIADSIAFKISKYGPMKYKIIAHRALDDVMRSGAKGAEIEIGGVIKERAAHFKFRPNGGVMPKTGQLEQFGVLKAKKQLTLKRGSIGIKVTVVVPKQMPGEVNFKDGRESERAGDGTPENEHKEESGVASS